MLFIIASWCLWYAIITGIGRLAASPWRQDIGTFDSFWLGLTCLIAVAGIAQLFFPLNTMAMSLAGAIGAVGLMLPPHSRPHRKDAPFLLACFVILLLTSLPSLCPTIQYSSDTRGYHLETIDWINSYATIPGLANLHSRLGYATASSFFSFAALLDNWIWDGRSSWLVVQFLLAATMLQITHALVYGSPRARTYSLICFAYLLLDLLWWRPGLYFESPVFHALIIAGLYAVDRLTPFALFIIPTLVMTAFTIKPMPVVLLALCTATYATAFIIKPNCRKAIALAAVIPTLLLFGYMARNVVTSGWALFPSPIPIGLTNAPWALSKDEVETEFHVIRNFDRLGPAFQMDKRDNPVREWVGDWLKRALDDRFGVGLFWGPLALSLLMTLYLGLCPKPHQRAGLPFGIPILTLLALYGSLIFWFFSNGSVRFAWPFAWLLMAWHGVALYDAGLLSVGRKTALSLAAAAGVAACLALLFIILPYRHASPSLWSTGRADLYPLHTPDPTLRLIDQRDITKGFRKKR
ncbi:MAG: hypothetical protein LBR38_06505 [Synergistaceae bacterium]|nr:hypothetical protein [Synergistaceae bacterium]